MVDGVIWKKGDMLYYLRRPCLSILDIWKQMADQFYTMFL